MFKHTVYCTRIFYEILIILIMNLFMYCTFYAISTRTCNLNAISSLEQNFCTYSYPYLIARTFLVSLDEDVILQVLHMREVSAMLKAAELLSRAPVELCRHPHQTGGAHLLVARRTLKSIWSIDTVPDQMYCICICKFPSRLPTNLLICKLSNCSLFLIIKSSILVYYNPLRILHNMY